MNIKTLVFVLVLVSLAFAFTSTAAVDTTTALGKPTTVKIDTTANTVKMDATTNTVKSEALTSGRLDVDVASTTAVAITALTGRDYVEIRSSQTAGEEIWVGIATAPTVGAGLCVTAASPLKLNVGTGVVIKTIASGAFGMAVFQGAY